MGFKFAGRGFDRLSARNHRSFSHCISLVAIWFGYAWAKRASGTTAAMIAALACSFFFGLVYFAPKAMNEVVAAHVMLPGLYLGVYGEKLGERKAAVSCRVSLRVCRLPAYSITACASVCDGLFLLSALARREFPAVAAGASVPVLFFGAVDWITWSYPWQSFIGYYKANMAMDMGKLFTLVQPWYWYALVLLVLLGPAVLLLFHGARRSPFLAIFCAIVVVSHSFIPHKEIRFIYPILAPAITMAAMGIVDLLHEIRARNAIPRKSRWVVAISVASSSLSHRRCWPRTAPTGTKPAGAIGAFDRLSREPAIVRSGNLPRESGGNLEGTRIFIAMCPSFRSKAPRNSRRMLPRSMR